MNETLFFFFMKKSLKWHPYYFHIVPKHAISPHFKSSNGKKIDILLHRVMLMPTQVNWRLETWDLPLSLGLKKKMIAIAGCHPVCEQLWGRTGHFFCKGFYRGLLTANSRSLGSTLGFDGECTLESTPFWRVKLSVFSLVTFLVSV